MSNVVIPYHPKPVQRRIHVELSRRRFCVLVAHRRMGKTVLSVNHLLRYALLSQRGDSRYGYVAPYRNQAESIAWAYLKKYSDVVPGRQVNEQKLSIAFPNGAQIRIFGADNPDALRGLYFDGVVMDEVAQMRREVWQEIIRPELADRKGWAVFIGTPKGINLFHDLYVRAQGDVSGEWAALMYRVHDTGALPDEEIAKLRAEMSDNAFRQEFLCDFSASSDNVLITIDDAVGASRRTYMDSDYKTMPLVLGVDVARFGDDRSVVFPRRGLVADAPVTLSGKDNVEVAQKIISLHHQWRPHSIFVDAGQGQGVIDIISRALSCVYEIPFGGQALDPVKYYNRRSEMWFLMREWIRAGGKIPDMPELVSELSAPLYSFNVAGKIYLEKKENIKERLGRSPDLADALALTFAIPVLPEVEQRQDYALRPQNIFADYELQPSGGYAVGFQPSLL
ncbi:MAG: terminase family protein [Desulfovibrio sp.]|jgi:hypothetical protein|nr:terminase family protein [Desulfovibrio sp.]